MIKEKDLFVLSVANHLMVNDKFSQWPGTEIIETVAGYNKVKMTVRPEMVNGFGSVHGGIAFSMSASAFCLCLQ